MIKSKYYGVFGQRASWSSDQIPQVVLHTSIYLIQFVNANQIFGKKNTNEIELKKFENSSYCNKLRYWNAVK